MALIGSIILGILAGFIASRIMKVEGNGCLINLLLGLIGGVVGGQVLGWVGFSSTGVVGSLITAVVGAVILIWLWHLIFK